MRIAIQFPSGRTHIGKMDCEGHADQLIYDVLDDDNAEDMGSYTWENRGPSDYTEDDGRIVHIDRVYILTPDDGGIYWPQSICEDCGVPCFGEEYA